jgi:hypothetical protein
MALHHDLRMGRQHPQGPARPALAPGGAALLTADNDCLIDHALASSLAKALVDDRVHQRFRQGTHTDTSRPVAVGIATADGFGSF